MFKKLLVANRGEIAQRIFNACKELGVQTVAIYSDADADAPWVKAADEAYPLGGVTATESYLDQRKIFDIVAQCGAEAIHPGYGFLSENATFAENCAKHGVKFIGPSPHAMEAMGSKANAREIAKRAGVPVTPGVDGAGKSDVELLEAAGRLGYPVLVKASAGGGGKGMRVVNSANEFLGALNASRNEARSSFGDDHIILEKFFTEIHHIEVQILGDEHGRVLHLFERECSIQRRHQKIIEESPSPTISDSVRQQITQAAVALAQEVGYYSAGTVEFMYTNDQNFYLLEMNTRLQVEHPITEAVTGIDIAKWQIRIAADEPLDFMQDDVQQQGHAIECRVYAEDPAMNFLPSIGEITHCQWPEGPRVRVDTGVTSGSAVSTYYDPMLAKVITWGQDRPEAIARMVAALKESVVLGVTTNIPYLLAILQEPNFQRGLTTTNYLEKYFADWSAEIELDDELWLAIAAFEALQGRGGVQLAAVNGTAVVNDPWELVKGWRNV